MLSLVRKESNIINIPGINDDKNVTGLLWQVIISTKRKIIIKANMIIVGLKYIYPFLISI